MMRASSAICAASRAFVSTGLPPWLLMKSSAFCSAIVAFWNVSAAYFSAPASRAVQHVLPTFQQFVFSVDVFNRTRGVVAHEVFHHHYIARLGHGEVRLGCYEHAEHLHRRGGLHTLVVPAQRKHTQL